MSEMVERVTQAIRTVQKRGPASHEMLASAAVAAMREPTEAMVEAGNSALDGCLMPDCGHPDVKWAYAAMIDAAGAEAPAEEEREPAPQQVKTFWNETVPDAIHKMPLPSTPFMDSLTKR